MTDGERAFYAWRAAENARWREAHPLCDLSGVDDAFAERALARRSGRLVPPGRAERIVFALGRLYGRHRGLLTSFWFKLLLAVAVGRLLRPLYQAVRPW